MKQLTKQAREDLFVEVDWLRSFGWPDERIAKRLGLTDGQLEKLLMRRRKREASSV